MSDFIPVKRALISVSDKDGLDELVKTLGDLGTEILSTGGTAKLIREAGVTVRDVSDYTGFPEMMDGRIKTLHPKVHGGLLALRHEKSHTQAMQDHEIEGIDLLVVNLYPFEETVRSGASDAQIIENIDIGGPAMIRSAAKNHQYVAVITDPEDYGALIEELKAQDGATGYGLRRYFAQKAFARTASYDAAINRWFASAGGTTLSDSLVLTATKQLELRYGENPHQQAAFYADPLIQRPGVATAEQIQGKSLSYNNLTDTDAAFELLAEFDAATPTVAIIKHANPCGAAAGASLSEAYTRALACDPVSAFGGIIAVNQILDEETAAEIVKVFTEVIIAPEISDQARKIISEKKNLRLLITGGMPDPTEEGATIRSISGGYLVQNRDNGQIGADDAKVVSKRKPSDKEMADLLFAFKICKHVKSNAIVYVKDGAAVGIGAGQMSRVDSSRIAALKAKDAAEAAGLAEPATVGSVVASDAFFPFPDGLLAAAEAGATAVIQPGGSMRDDQVIEAADDAGLAMVFTGMRHFRH